MVQSRLSATIQWVLPVCSFFIMFSQLAHTEQHAILVGVWNYENPNLQLDAPPNDLKLMEAVLSAHGVAQAQIHILSNPNKAQIQRKFRELSRRLNRSDSLLFYFSGHGTQIIDKLGTFPGDEAKGRYPDRNDKALLPVDANLASPRTYPLDDELNTLLQELPTRRVSCIIDTCYSGDILRGIRLGRPKGSPVTDTPTGIVQPTQSVSHTEDLLDESADFALLLAAYNQVVHELRIPTGKTYLPISAMTYSLYRRVFAPLQSPVNQAIEVQWHDKLTYRNKRSSGRGKSTGVSSYRCRQFPAWCRERCEHAALGGCYRGLNAAGRKVEGFQAAAGLNVSGGALNGFQAVAGINATGGSVRGFQVAGGGNFAARNLQGLQITAGLNLVGRNVLSQGLQIAAGANIAGNLEGTQPSTAANIALG